MKSIRRILMAVASLLGAIGLGVLGTGLASAHVTVSANTATAGSYSVLTFSVPHGCKGSPTIRIAIQIPKGINAATPTINPNWSVKKVMKELKDPITDSEGSKLTERVDQVVYTAKTPLPDGYRDTLAVQLQLPENAAGKTLVFPTVQTCQQGETAWIQVPARGQDPEELDAPAPSLKVTAAADDKSVETASAAIAAKSQGNSTSMALGVAGLVAGLAGLAAGATALILRNKPIRRNK